MGHRCVVWMSALVVIVALGACTAAPSPTASPATTPSRCPPGTLCYAPSPSASASSSPGSPTPQAAGFTFARVPLPPLSGGSLSIADLAAAGPLFVAVGRATDEGEALVLTSADGHVWSRVPDQPAFHDPGGALAMDAVAARADGLLVAVGVVTDRAGRVREGAAWWSSDGEHWQRAPRPPSFVGADPAAAGLVATATDFVVVGSRAGRPAIWTSPDGRTWMLAHIPTAPDGASLAAVTAGGPGLIAVGGAAATSSRYRVPLWTSSDGGQQWIQDPEAPGPVPDAEPMGAAFTAVACRPGLCVTGARLDPGPGQSFAGISLRRYFWTSPDGLHWTSLDVTMPATGPQLDEVTWTGTAFVASGDYPQGGERRAWWSSDGVTWQEVPLPTATSTLPSWTRLVTAHGLVFAVTGIANEPGTLWIGVPASS